MKKNIITYYLERFISSKSKNAESFDCEDELINNELLSQWNNNGIDTKEYNSQKGWLHISNNISDDNKKISLQSRRKSLLQYAAVACFAAIIVLGCTMLFLKPQETIKEIYVYTTGKQDEKTILLSDGTKVKLGAQSQLIYPAQFDGNKREVKLDGLAFFDVTKNEEQPFSVNVNNLNINVLGTSFEIFENKETEIVETSLLTGKVEVVYNYRDGQKQDRYILAPNERLTLACRDGISEKDTLNVANHVAWRGYNGLQFITEDLNNIIPRLERWYNSKIVWDKKKHTDLKFSFKVKNEPLEAILDLLSKSADMTYKVEEDLDYNKTYILKTK